MAALLCALLHLLPATPLLAEQRAVVGHAEHVWFPAISASLSAKIDTGATTSSIHAVNIQEFDRHDQAWVRFEIPVPPLIYGPIEAKLIRSARIRRAGAKVQNRPVVRLEICIAAISDKTEFNLTDRDGMDYPVLIGRSFLKDRLLIDPGRPYLAEKGCKPVMR